MSRLRKLIVPYICKMLWLFFAVTVATDDLVVQSALLSVSPTFNQSLCNDDPGDFEGHTWKVFKDKSSIKNDNHLLNLVIRTYLDQAARLLIPSSPDIFFQPDRSPPVSFQ